MKIFINDYFKSILTFINIKAALIPIYTGKTEEELPSVLKSDPKGRYVDEAYPFIWKDLLNYVSLHLDDWPQVSAFTYRMRGFLNHTATHYLKHYQLRLWDRVSPFYFTKNNTEDDFCMGSKKRHKILLDLLLDFKRIYKNISNNLAIMHYVENSHDTNERFNWVDNDLFDFLSTGFTDGLFNDTAIFLFSDHGARFNDKRSSSNRYIEERLPFFAVYLPEQYKKEYKNKYNSLLLNSNLLTSPFDIHATVKDLTCSDSEKQKKDTKYRSISLLNKISPERNCQHIGISDHFCSCVQDWRKLKTNRKNIENVAKFAVSSINNITNSVRDLCLHLKLKEIISAEFLFKENFKIYKIQLVTEPNNGTYEILVYKGNFNNFEFKSDKFSIESRNEISRIDAYGSQPSCVLNLNGTQFFFLDLRKFCYCSPKPSNDSVITNLKINSTKNKIN